MFGRKKDQQQNSGESSKPAKGKDPADQVKTGGWTEDELKARWAKFNGPEQAAESLRISMTKDAYAELIAHAKENVSNEICGVVLGEICEDEAGLWVNVEAAIRGSAAREGGAHVTFTQDTWNQIHEIKEKRFPKKQIVGWYHSHPGFGVEFSDMDMFIQRNFFSGKAQIAFVSDPLGGEEAISANTSGGIVPIGRFWVDGRERRCYMPEGASSGAKVAEGAAAVVPQKLQKTLDQMEDRMRQLAAMVESQQNALSMFLTTLGMFVAVIAVVTAAWYIWGAYTDRRKPPQPIPGTQIVWSPIIAQEGKPPVRMALLPMQWEVPPELDERAKAFEEGRKAGWAELIKKLQEEQAAATRGASSQASSQPTSMPTSMPASQPAK